MELAAPLGGRRQGQESRSLRTLGKPALPVAAAATAATAATAAAAAVAAVSASSAPPENDEDAECKFEEFDVANDTSDEGTGGAEGAWTAGAGAEPSATATAAAAAAEPGCEDRHEKLGTSICQHVAHQGEEVGDKEWSALEGGGTLNGSGHFIQLFDGFKPFGNCVSSKFCGLKRQTYFDCEA